MSSESSSFGPAASHEDISQRARQLWETAGSPADRDLEFWLAAESSLRRQRGNSQPADREPTAPKRAATRRR